MFGIGFTELLIVLVVALLVLGPDKLPEVARTAAKAYNELRRTGLDLKRTVKDMNLADIVKDSLDVEDKKGVKKSDEVASSKSASTDGAQKASRKAT